MPQLRERQAEDKHESIASPTQTPWPLPDAELPPAAIDLQKPLQGASGQIGDCLTQSSRQVHPLGASASIHIRNAASEISAENRQLVRS